MDGRPVITEDLEEEIPQPETKLLEYACGERKRNELRVKECKERHFIQLKDDIPIFSKPYKVPDSYKVKLQEAIDDLPERRIIRESDSFYASPLSCLRNAMIQPE